MAKLASVSTSPLSEIKQPSIPVSVGSVLPTIATAQE